MALSEDLTDVIANVLPRSQIVATLRRLHADDGRIVGVLIGELHVTELEAWQIVADHDRAAPDN